MKIWCGLCSCSFDQAVTFTHTRGKKHSKKNKNMSKLFSLLPNDIKITCISYIFPRVHNFISFCRQIHSYNMNQCMYQLNVYGNFHTRCTRCSMPYDTLSYDQFVFYLSRHKMCMSCAYNVVTTSNYLKDLFLYIHNGFIYMCSSDAYVYINVFERFDRMLEIFKKLSRFNSRNNFTTLQFDLSTLSYFWTFDEFLAYVYWYSYNQLQIIDLYMLQSNV
jgi:hypothetical protein